MHHKNFCKSESLNVMTVDTASGRLITIGQIAGSVSFYFAINPAQARELAADLVKQADEAEGV